MNKNPFANVKMPDFKVMLAKLMSKEQKAKNPALWPAGAKLVRVSVLRLDEMVNPPVADAMSPVIDAKSYAVEFKPAEANSVGKTSIRPGTYVLVRVADGKYVFQHGHINVTEAAWHSKVQDGSVNVISYTL